MGEHVSSRILGVGMLVAPYLSHVHVMSKPLVFTQWFHKGVPMKEGSLDPHPAPTRLLCDNDQKAIELISQFTGIRSLRTCHTHSLFEVLFDFNS